MAKSDRKKLVSTQVVGATIIMHRVDTGAELGRIDTRALTEAMRDQTLIYGAKQIVSDVNAQLEGEAKFEGISRAIAALGSGTWPARTSAPMNMETAILTLMAQLHETREQVEARLGIVV